MRTLRFKPSLPTCIHRKVSDERPKRTLEMGDFPLHILETRRKERLAELKAECVELQTQLSENNLPAAVKREADLKNGTKGRKKQAPTLSSKKSSPTAHYLNLKSQYSKSMQELRRLPPGLISNGSGSTTLSTATICSVDTMRLRREERLQHIRRELEDFAIKYSLGEFADKIDGIRSSNTSPTKKSDSNLTEEAPLPNGNGQHHLERSGTMEGLDAADTACFLRIQRQREQELQRARLELKHLAFRLKHKIDEENEIPSGDAS